MVNFDNVTSNVQSKKIEDIQEDIVDIQDDIEDIQEDIQEE
jgi:peptidoglycan hydrolase CwlO-like protein